jgi:hypothetical protein
VTVARRLDALETSLTPTGRVIAWLEEAHAYRSLSAYVDYVLDQPAEAFPINRLTREAAAAARAEVGRKPSDLVDAAVRKALRATVLRFELVLRINVVAHEMIEREVLLYAAFAATVGMLVSDDRQERISDPAYRRHLGQARDLTAQRVDELLAAAEARSIVETRYMAGRVALFPDAVEQWDERVRLAMELAVMTDRIAALDGLPPAGRTDPAAVSARAAVLVADLVEPARATALEKLDEGHHAHRIATDWLRSRLVVL